MSSTTADSVDGSWAASSSSSSKHFSDMVEVEKNAPPAFSTDPLHLNPFHISSSITSIAATCTGPIDATEEVTTAIPTSLNHHIIDISEPPQTLAPRNSPIKLGKTVLSLTFQAALALMIFHFQSSPASPPDHPPSPSPRPALFVVEMVEVAMMIGFAGAFAGVFLHQAYPCFALYMEYAGSFAAAFGFFGIATMSLSKAVSLWLMWPMIIALLVLLLILALPKAQAVAMQLEIRN